MFETFRERRRLRDAPLFRIFTMGSLVMVLLIPLGMVGSLIAEREGRRAQSTAEVAETWGAAQILGGPVLTVPYREWVKDDKGRITAVPRAAQFLPETLHVEGQVLPERRSRGIYEVVLYRARLQVTGTFQRPSFADWHVAPEDVLWNDAHLSLGITDLRGLHRAGDLVWQGRRLPLAPGGGEGGLWDSGLRTTIPGLGVGAVVGDGAVQTFAVDLEIDGHGCLSVLPFGKQTTMTLRSPWPDPSFNGAFLPETRTVKADGFTATWSVPYFGRSYPQQWRTEEVRQVIPEKAIYASQFGVSLFLPVDSYQKTERSRKYAVLFLVLTFLTFFLYENWSPVQLHPMQYLLVGAALCLFYLLLLSISEHLAFALAYAVAATATVGLITGYAWSLLAGGGRALALGGVLTALYGYLYVLLQVEDYALLLGSIGLFVILAVVMYLTRRVNWSGRRPGEVGEVGEEVLDAR